MVAFVAVPGPQTPASPDVVVSGETEPSDVPTAQLDDQTAVDDPLVALRELATRRDACVRDLSVLCLDGVDEAASAAWDADRAAIMEVLAGGEAPPALAPGSATLVERLGDSALVDLGPDSDPASVLLLKGEAGWRIRDYLAPIDAGEAEG